MQLVLTDSTLVLVHIDQVTTFTNVALDILDQKLHRATGSGSFSVQESGFIDELEALNFSTSASNPIGGQARVAR